MAEKPEQISHHFQLHFAHDISILAKKLEEFAPTKQRSCGKELKKGLNQNEKRNGLIFFPSDASAEQIRKNVWGEK